MMGFGNGIVPKSLESYCENCKHKFQYYGLDEGCSHERRFKTTIPPPGEVDYDSDIYVCGLKDRISDLELEVTNLKNQLEIGICDFARATGRNAYAVMVDWTKDAEYAPSVLWSKNFNEAQKAAFESAQAEDDDYAVVKSVPTLRIGP